MFCARTSDIEIQDDGFDERDHHEQPSKKTINQKEIEKLEIGETNGITHPRAMVVEAVNTGIRNVVVGHVVGEIQLTFSRIPWKLDKFPLSQSPTFTPQLRFGENFLLNFLSFHSLRGCFNNVA